MSEKIELIELGSLWSAAPDKPRSRWLIRSAMTSTPPAQMARVYRMGRSSAASEGLEEFDQRALVVVAQPRLPLEGTRAEVVTAVDHVVGTLAQLDEIGDEVVEHRAGLGVARVPWQLLEVVLGLDQEFEQLVGLLRAI